MCTKQKVGVKIRLIRLVQVILGDNTSINIFLVKMDLCTNIFAGYLHDVSVLFEKRRMHR